MHCLQRCEMGHGAIKRPRTMRDSEGAFRISDRGKGIPERYGRVTGAQRAGRLSANANVTGLTACQLFQRHAVRPATFTSALKRPARLNCSLQLAMSRRFRG